jgi:hypothetical protein
MTKKLIVLLHQDVTDLNQGNLVFIEKMEDGEQAGQHQEFNKKTDKISRKKGLFSFMSSVN